jgi:23S rRNA pseudouridine1911/1915/1917 synthase
VKERLVQFYYRGESGERLDKFLVDCLPDFSRSRLQALIKAGMVTIDGNPASKSGYILDHEALVEVYIPPPAPSELIPESIPLDILFENGDFLVVNKPAGMVVHPPPDIPTVPVPPFCLTPISRSGSCVQDCSPSG